MFGVTGMTVTTKTQQEISKSNFKAHTLEVMRDIERTGDEIVITSHGKPALIVKKFKRQTVSPLEKLRGSVVKYSSPTTPVCEDDFLTLIKLAICFKNLKKSYQVQN
jgi:antitoxin (DNA-binding transcriptional repressor) of toxin-antitoxin stability system